MIEQRKSPPTGQHRRHGRLGARQRHWHGRFALLGLILLAGLGCWAGAIGGAPAFASGERGSEHGSSPGDSAFTPAAGTWCPTFGRLVSSSGGVPVQLTAGVGSTQSTRAGTSFPLGLAVTVTDAHGNPVAGALVTLSAPLAGASGRFTIHSRGPHHRTRVSHPHTVKVKSGACGIAVAPAFTANDTPGGYVVEATVKHARPVAFALVNQAPGQAP